MAFGGVQTAYDAVAIKDFERRVDDLSATLTDKTYLRNEKAVLSASSFKDLPSLRDYESSAN
jgi:hypothetical protein